MMAGVTCWQTRARPVGEAGQGYSSSPGVQPSAPQPRDASEHQPMDHNTILNGTSDTSSGS